MRPVDPILWATKLTVALADVHQVAGYRTAVGIRSLYVEADSPGRSRPNVHKGILSGGRGTLADAILEPFVGQPATAAGDGVESDRIQRGAAEATFAPAGSGDAEAWSAVSADELLVHR